MDRHLNFHENRDNLVCDDVWGQVDGASAGGGLRRGDHPGTTDGDGRLLDSDRFLVEVDVAAAQACELPEPEPAPGIQQHQEPVTRRHCIGQDLHLGDGEQSDVFRGAAGGGALDSDR